MAGGARLVMVGKQGAGKGTQCVRLGRHYVVPHIATGDMFRAAVRSGSSAGRRASSYMGSGELVPDEVVLEVVAERMDQDDIRHRGFVLDGFPRTVEQAKGLAEILSPADIHLVLDIEVPTEMVLERLASRRVCTDCGANYSVTTPPKLDWTCDECGGEVVQRPDDTEAAIERRLAVYEERTRPLVQWYGARRQLVVVDGTGPPDEVTASLIAAVDARLGRA